MMPTGWSCGSRTIGEMGRLYPGSSAARVFFRPGEGLPASAWTDPARVGRQRLVDLPANCTAIVSFKDQFVDRAAFVDAWLKYRPDVDLVLITHHEPEQQDGGDPTRAQYRASWTLTREQVGAHPARAEGRLRLATCWTLQWIRRGGDWWLWWPEHEADAVDLLLFDWYPFMASEPNPWKPRVYEDPASALKVPVGIAGQLGKAWGFAEFDHPRILTTNGFTVDLDPDGELAAPWYRAMHAAAKAAGCRVWAHFHANAGAAVGDLTKRPAEQQVLRELIEQEATMGRWTDLAKWVGPTPNQSGPMNRHDGVVLHIAEGSYDGTIAWQRNPDADVSSHFIVALDGRIAQMVDTDVTAWTQRAGNGEWLSVENEGRLPTALTDAQVEANARILAKAHQVYGVPLQVTDTPAKRGLGHHSMGAENGYDWGHPSCPGAAIKAQKAAIVARAKQIINGEDDMQLTDKIGLVQKPDVKYSSTSTTVEGVLASTNYYVLQTRNKVLGELATIRAELAAAAGRDPFNEQEVIDGVLAGLDPAALAARIAEHLPAEQAQQVADELARRLVS